MFLVHGQFQAALMGSLSLSWSVGGNADGEMGGGAQLMPQCNDVACGVTWDLGQRITAIFQSCAALHIGLCGRICSYFPVWPNIIKIYPTSSFLLLSLYSGFLI